MSSEPQVSTERKTYYDKLFENMEPVKDEFGIETCSIPYKSNTEWTKMEVYEIPIGEGDTGLWYNIYNSRILAYKKQREAKLQRKLDQSNEEDRKFLEDKLITSTFYSSTATADLEEELKTTGQREPAIISCDGIIWNANRRIAVRKKLGSDTGDPKWNKVKVVRLPPDLKFKQLKQLEHILQMSKSFKEEYGSITLRLRCREAINDENWSYEELNNSFANSYNKKKIDTFIEEINLIDYFLERIGNKDDYPLVESKGAGKGVEIFTAVNNHLKWEKNKNRTTDDEIEKIRTIFFSIIHQPMTTYEDTRDLVKQFKNPQTRELFLANSLIYKNFGEYTTPTSGKEKAFELTTTSAEYSNKKQTQAVLESIKDPPLDVVSGALERLRSIRDEKIEKNEKTFLGVLEKIEKTVSHLKEVATGKT